ncbi:MAG TPA: hypothetical protein VMX13_07520 [Sedimentisphaerales bacterium]|nr:hypothetical protein [Sedimentisphaerales bacterium]
MGKTGKKGKKEARAKVDDVRGDDVDRSYYVYIHKDRQSGVPFYVGRGKGKRAYKTDGRSSAWGEKVDSLSEGYSVEIVKEHLTEDESCDVEMDLIEKYGRLCDGNGTLVNMTDGGEDILGVTFRVSFPASLAERIEEDYKSRKYKELNPSQEKDFIEKLIRDMEHFQEVFLALQKKAGRDECDALVDLDCIIGGAIESTIHLAKKRLRKKISYKDFAYGIEEAFEDTEIDLQDFEPAERTEQIVSLGNKVVEYLRERVVDLKPFP